MSFDITGIGSVLDFGGKLIDRFFPDKKIADAAKLEMFKAQQAGEFKQLDQVFELEKGCRRHSKKTIATSSKTLPLTNELFKNDALIFDNLKENQIIFSDGNEMEQLSKLIEARYPSLKSCFGFADSLNEDSNIQNANYNG